MQRSKASNAVTQIRKQQEGLFLRLSSRRIAILMTFPVYSCDSATDSIVGDEERAQQSPRHPHRYQQLPSSALRYSQTPSTASCNSRRETADPSAPRSTYSPIQGDRHHQFEFLLESTDFFRRQLIVPQCSPARRLSLCSRRRNHLPRRFLVFSFPSTHLQRSRHSRAASVEW